MNAAANRVQAKSRSNASPRAATETTDTFSDNDERGTVSKHSNNSGCATGTSRAAPTRSRRRIRVLAGAVLAGLAFTGVSVPAATAAPPVDPRAAYLGNKLETGPRVAAGAMSAAAAAALPASADLSQYTVVSGDQGPVPSCTSWAVAYSIAGWYGKKTGAPGLPFAPLYVYSQVTGGKAVGTSFGDTLRMASSSGIDTLADYTQGNFDYKTLPTPRERALAANYRLTGYRTLYNEQLDAARIGAETIKTALAAGTPVAIGVRVYDNFFSIGPNNDHYVGVTGTFRGNHAMAVFAYDSFGIKVQNSWGKDWGKDGFAWLSWDFVAKQTHSAYAVTGVSFPAVDDAPMISSVSPSTGPLAGGSVATITGDNLTGARVEFNNTLTTLVRVSADGTKIEVVVPKVTQPNDSPILITTPNGKVTAGSYKYRAPAPQITSVTPGGGAHTGGNTVVINGTNLDAWSDGSLKVRFGDTEATKVTASGTRLVVSAPPHDLGRVDITVTSSSGASKLASSYLYGYASRPVLWLQTPLSAGGSSIVVKPGLLTIQGSVRTTKSGLTTQATLSSRPSGSTAPWVTVGTFDTAANGVFYATQEMSSSQEFRFSIPGEYVSPTFTVTVRPLAVLERLSVATGKIAGAQQITVTGRELTGASFYFGSQAARVVSASPDGTWVVIATPPVTSPTTVQLTARKDVGTSNSLPYTYTR